MNRTTEAWNEVLANVNWKWQYVKDVTWEYSQKVQALSSVVYNNTLRHWVDLAAAWVNYWINVWKKAYHEAWRQYREELASIRWETSLAAKWADKPAEKSGDTPKEYQVKSWDTLSRIALTEVWWDKSKAWEYLKKILEANKWVDPNKIAVWQKLSLPKIA